MKEKAVTILDIGIPILVGGVFVWAGVGKMIDPWSFAVSVDSFRVLPAILVSPVTLILPPLEIIAAIVWMLRRRSVAAPLLILGLLGVFLLLIALAIHRGTPADCGCFGAIGMGASSLWIALGRDLALTVATLFWLFVLPGRIIGEGTITPHVPADRC